MSTLMSLIFWIAPDKRHLYYIAMGFIIADLILALILGFTINVYYFFGIFYLLILALIDFLVCKYQDSLDDSEN